MFAYKLVFGLTDLKLSDLFLLRSDARFYLEIEIEIGDRYFATRDMWPLCATICSSTTRHNYFTHRVARAWNNLPENSANLSSLALFKRKSELEHPS